MLYDSYPIWTFSLPSLTGKKDPLQLLYHRKPRYFNIRMCSKEKSESLYIDLLTSLTLNKQRHGFGNGTINPFSNTLLILDQEVEI